MDPDAHAPRCPTCGTTIQSHWDWCHFCGYDPDNLKPVGWRPGTDPAAEPEPAGRRQRKEARRTTKTEPTEKKPGRRTGKKTARQPVAAGAVPVLATAGAAVAADDTVDIASMLDAFVAHDDGDPAEPKRSSLPPLVIEPSPARTSRQVPVRTAEVFHVKPAPVELAAALVLLLVGVGAAYFAVTGIIQVADGASTTMLDNVATVVFILLCAVVACAALVQARALMRQSVELTPNEMAVRNRFGRVRRVPRNEIHTLRMGERDFPVKIGPAEAFDAPYAQLTDGSCVWLDALSSRPPATSPTDEQLAMYDRLAAALASTGTRV
ncbi:MAG TPA: hypothetical protein VMT43_08970 [Acidimicrobiales bacterium]|nr:hypothetical protein [Acidimicrobiales bacterium]